MYEVSDGEGVAMGRWRLAGDTLIMEKMTGKIGKQPRKIKAPSRLVTIKSQQLTITRLENNSSLPKTQVYERLADSVKVDPNKP